MGQTPTELVPSLMSVNYAIEAINLLAQVSGLLPPATRMMHMQFDWRCRKEYQLDLQMEHLNRIFKENTTFLGQTSLKRVFQEDHKLSDQFSYKSSCSGKEIILQTLKRKKVFTHVKGRHYESFNTFDTDPFAKLKRDPKKLHAWIRSKVNQIMNLEQQILSMHHHNNST